MKLFPSTNITPPRILVVRQDTTKGISVHLTYRRGPGTNTLTSDGSLTRFMVLQVKLTPLTPGRTPVPGRQVTSLTTTIVTYVL